MTSGNGVALPERSGQGGRRVAVPSPPSSVAATGPWPRISIVTPSFNQGAFVEEAIRSVLLQGYPNLELIVVDGSSTDGTVETIARYQTWLAHWICENDNGPASALNKGFRLATGDIFGFLNADDFYLPGCLTRVAQEFLARPDADVVSGHGYLAKASGELGAPVFSDHWSLQRFAYGACVLVQPSTFFRRRVFELVRGFNEQNRTCWDMELWADLALTGATFHAIDDFMAAFRLHTASITCSPHLKAKRLRETREVMERVRGDRARRHDRLYEFLHRIRKFSGHPRRTLSQRLFFYSTLKRWSL